MPRQPRANQNGVIFHHIMVQGINREYVFDNEILMSKYLELVMKYSEELGISIIAYCIMNNHVHLLVYSENIRNMSNMMQRINSMYAKFYNLVKGRVGYVFRDRYVSQPITSDKQFVNCVKYIHDNPVKAKIVKEPKQYKYSNYIEFYRKSNLKAVKKLVGIDFEPMQNKTTYIEGEFVDLEFNVKELVLGCLSRFCNERQIQLSDILSNLNNLKSVIRYMKYDYKISYMHIMEIMKIPLNVMQTMKNK